MRINFGGGEINYKAITGNDFRPISLLCKIVMSRDRAYFEKSLTKRKISGVSENNLSKLRTMPSGDNSGILLNNVVVTTVPLPAVVWLFGSGLMGIGWLRRTQTN